MLDFLVIGAQKAGSSALHEALRNHPDIYMPRREIPYFEDPEYLTQSRDVIRRISDGGSGSKAVGIKRPDYLARAECPERIARECPDAKLVVCLRDPIDRALSAYYYYMLLGFLPVAPPDQGFEEILSGELESVYPRAREVIEYGFYGEQLERYYEHFPRTAVKVVFHDDLREQPESVLSSVHRFLGVEAGGKVSVSNRKRGINSLSALSRIARLRPVLYRYEHGGIRVVARVRGVPRLVFGAVMRYERLAGIRREGLDEKTLSALAAEYRQDLRKLRRLTEEPLPQWPTIERCFPW